MTKRVRVETEDEILEGVRIPSDDEYVTLKLDSGYNVGISTDRIVAVEELEDVSEASRSTSSRPSSDSSLPDVALLHTGGTIASRVDYTTGAVVSQYEPEDILDLFPELHDIANLRCEFLTNIQSEMMRFDHYNVMAEAVKRERERGVDGVIITHGTDTMHYSSAALTFALPGLDIPVVFVGSQRSSDRPSTDARANLMAACQFIADTDVAGVGICMHESSSDETCLINPPCKTRKMHTSRRDAFRPINAKPIARVDVEEETTEVVCEPEGSDEEFRVERFDPELRIAMLQAHPNMYAMEFDHLHEFDGVVFQLMALGHAPNMDQDEYTGEHERIADAIRELTRAVPVVACSQSLYGALNLQVYTPQRLLLEQGVVGDNTDMTPETAFVKLAWLLSQYDDKERVESLYVEDLRGEISASIHHDEFLL